MIALNGTFIIILHRKPQLYSADPLIERHYVPAEMFFNSISKLAGVVLCSVQLYSDLLCSLFSMS